MDRRPSRGHLSSLVIAAVITGAVGIIFNNITEWSFPAVEGKATETVSSYPFFVVLLAGAVFLAAYLYLLRRTQVDEARENSRRQTETLRDGLLSAILNIDRAIIIIDKECHVAHVNPAAEKLIGMKCDSCKGKYLQEVWPNGAINFNADSGKTEIALPTGPGRQILMD